MGNTEPTSDQILEKLKKYQIISSSVFVRPNPVVKIGEASICTEGNLTVISGEPKSGKSALSSVILAGAIRENDQGYDGFASMQVDMNIHGRGVVHIDTEQARHDHCYAIKNNIVRRAGLVNEPDFFKSYNFRGVDLKDFKKLTWEAFKAIAEKYNGLHLAVIDGAADYIPSVNDEVASNDIVRFFELLAQKYRVPIVLIIHHNPQSEKQRGHLGSQLQRKAESLIAVVRKGNGSYVKDQLLRSAGRSDFARIEFQFDKSKGYHVSTGISTRPEPEELEALELADLATQIFSNPLGYTEAVEKLREITKLADRTCKNRIASMTNSGLIEKNNGKYTLKEPVSNNDSPTEETSAEMQGPI
jgi:hypothetical protein